MKETLERASMLGVGITRYVTFKVSEAAGFREAVEEQNNSKSTQNNVTNVGTEIVNKGDGGFQSSELSRDAGDKSTEMKELQLPQRKYASVKEKIETITKSGEAIPKIELSSKDKELLRKLELEHEEKIKKQWPEANVLVADEIKNSQARIEDNKNETIPQVRTSKPAVRPRQTVS